MSDINNGATRQLLKAKALGFTNAIAKLSREERGQNPSVSFGEDYNRLRSSVEKAFPQLKEFLPPEAKIFRNHPFEGTVQLYGELFSWAEQLYQLLSALEA